MAAKRAATKLEQSLMIADYLAGATAKEAAAKLGYTKIVCIGALKRNGIAPRTNSEAHIGQKAHNELPECIQDALVQAYLSGLSAQEAANQFGVSKPSCLRALKRRGAKPRESPEELQANGKWSKAVSARMQGISLDEWQGYVSSKWRQVMNSSEYGQWRHAVIKRDGGLCRVCSERPEVLEIHHILPKAKYPALALSVDNGITLCNHCHRAVRGKEEKLASVFQELVRSSGCAPQIVKKVDEVEIVSDYVKGHSFRRIRQKYGVDFYTIRKALTRQGVPIRTKSEAQLIRNQLTVACSRATA